MRILALDTATELCSAALLLDEALLQREQRLERGHAAAILPMVDELLRAAGITLRSLTALAFGRGPGTFTGVRLAASVTQGLAFGAGLPVVPVSDLRALAQRSLDEDVGVGRVLVCADARMAEVYWGCFEDSGEGCARAYGEERVSSPDDVRLPPAWSSAAPVTGGEPTRSEVAGVGSGFIVYPQLRTLLPPPGRSRGELLPRAAEVARLAVREVLANRILSPEQAVPVYLRNDVARVSTGT